MTVIEIVDGLQEVQDKLQEYLEFRINLYEKELAKPQARVEILSYTAYKEAYADALSKLKQLQQAAKRRTDG